MKSVYNFVVRPKGDRYNNKTQVDDSELILNTEIYNHQYVNREAIVISFSNWRYNKVVNTLH